MNADLKSDLWSPISGGGRVKRPLPGC